ncbi:MAG: RNA polymerase sigma factor [Noviherbaspirillum sp.]
MGNGLTLETGRYLESARSGDAAAFSHLVDLYYSRVWRFLIKWVKNREDAEELAQETFLAAWRNLSGFRADAQFSTWLLGIALNLARNHHNRSPAKRWEVELDEAAHMETPALRSADPQVQWEQKSSLLALQRAIDGLPADMREVILLIRLEGLSLEQAASMLDVPVGTVKSRLSRARDKLKESMGRHR